MANSEHRSSPRNAPTAQRIARRISLVVGAFLALTSFVATMSPSVFETPAGSNPALQATRNLLPQGWAFFTRDAREDTYTAYRQDDGSWTAISPISSSSPRFKFGLDRGARLVDGDIARIAVAETESGVDSDDSWTRCRPNASIDDCVRGNDVRSDGRQTLHPLIAETCGTILIARVSPIPWSYGKLTREHKKSIRIVEVECR